MNKRKIKQDYTKYDEDDTDDEEEAEECGKLLAFFLGWADI
jgi:hypothetical protein